MLKKLSSIIQPMKKDPNLYSRTETTIYEIKYTGQD